MLPYCLWALDAWRSTGSSLNNPDGRFRSTCRGPQLFGRPPGNPMQRDARERVHRGIESGPGGGRVILPNIPPAGLERKEQASRPPEKFLPGDTDDGIVQPRGSSARAVGRTPEAFFPCPRQSTYKDAVRRAFRMVPSGRRPGYQGASRRTRDAVYGRRRSMEMAQTGKGNGERAPGTVPAEAQ